MAEDERSDVEKQVLEDQKLVAERKDHKGEPVRRRDEENVAEGGGDRRGGVTNEE